MPSVFSRLSPWLTPQYIALLVSSYIALRLVQRFLASRAANAKLRRTQAVKQARMQAQLKIVEDKLQDTHDERRKNGLEDAIVNSSATQVVARIADGTYSAKVVLHSLLARTVRAQDAFNVLSESNFDRALEDADALDQRRSSKQPLGRLHGLPISLKDSVNLAGLDTTLGLCRFAGQPAAADALIVQLLRAQGAVFHAKSNIPQTLLSFECVNPLHGRTTNPFNINLTPGGSSGGESALLATGGSLVGIGTDIGGSVRIPAHFSGNTALKPTARRLSLQGFRASVPGQEAIPAVAGPMAQRVEDLSLLLRELWTPAAWARDHDLAPVPFDEAEVKNDAKLTVGYYLDDGFLGPSPACARAVQESVDALRAAGHTCVAWQPPRVQDVIAMYYALITSDKAATLARQLEGEVWEDYCSTLITGVRMPPALKSLVASLLRNVLKEPKAAALAGASRERTVAELWALQAARKALRQEWFDAWRDPATGRKFDVVLTPVHVLPAVPHHTFKKISFTCSYTLLFNVLDLPAGVLPVCTVDAARDAYTSAPTSLLDKTARGAYKLQEQHGLPVGVQVVGLQFKDETVLRAMRIIEGLVNFQQPQVRWPNAPEEAL